MRGCFGGLVCSVLRLGGRIPRRSPVLRTSRCMLPRRSKRQPLLRGTRVPQCAAPTEPWPTLRSQSWRRCVPRVERRKASDMRPWNALHGDGRADCGGGGRTQDQESGVRRNAGQQYAGAVLSLSSNRRATQFSGTGWSLTLSTPTSHRPPSPISCSDRNLGNLALPETDTCC